MDLSLGTTRLVPLVFFKFFTIIPGKTFLAFLPPSLCLVAPSPRNRASSGVGDQNTHDTAVYSVLVSYPGLYRTTVNLHDRNVPT